MSLARVDVVPVGEARALGAQLARADTAAFTERPSGLTVALARGDVIGWREVASAVAAGTVAKSASDIFAFRESAVLNVLISRADIFPVGEARSKFSSFSTADTIALRESAAVSIGGVSKSAFDVFAFRETSSLLVLHSRADNVAVASVIGESAQLTRGDVIGWRESSQVDITAPGVTLVTASDRFTLREAAGPVRGAGRK